MAGNGREEMTTLEARGVKAWADFVGIVSRYTRLRRAGRQYVGLCPFHQERHPSFYVEPERKIWKCFGCGAGGDLFAFVMLKESLPFLEAVRWVENFSGGRRMRPAVFAGRMSQGAKPPSLRSRHAAIVRKPEPRPMLLHPSLAPWAEHPCAAERAESLLLVRRQITEGG